MKIKKNKLNKRLYLIIAVAILVCCAVGYGIFWMLSQRNNPTTQIVDPNQINYSEPSDADKKISSDQKDQTIKQNDQREQTPAQPTDQSPSVTINRAGQVSSDTFSLRSIVNGSGQGNCSLELSKGSISFTKQFSTTNIGSYYACNTDIPLAEFNEDGKWNANLIYKLENASPSQSSISFEISK